MNNSSFEMASLGATARSKGACCRFLRRTLPVFLAAMALAWTPPLQAENKIPDEYRTGGFFIGCQAYTFNRFTVVQAMDKTVEAGGKIFELSNGQKWNATGGTWDYRAPIEVQTELKDRLEQHHLKAVNFGVIDVSKDEKEARKLFEFAKFMGLRAIVTESVESMDTIEKMVKEYDVLVGFHNHPRRADDPNYRLWDPHYVAGILKNRDLRIGSCSDIGHWVRSNLKPVDCLRILRGLIVSCHLKDLNTMGPGARDVPFGTGVSDIPGILEELRKQGFQGNLSIEYEYNWDHSVPEVGQCIGFVRGYGSARKW